MAGSRWWSRLRGRATGTAGLQGAVEELSRSMRALADAQRKQAAQLKKIREAQTDMDARWQAALDRWQKQAADAGVRQAQEARHALEKASDGWRRTVRDSQEYQKTEQKWRVLFSRQIDSLIRRLYLSPGDVEPSFEIAASRFRLRSQNEEDGIILALLRRAGVTDRRFVEVGCGRTGGNAAMLAYECGWRGLMIDSGSEAIDAVRRRFRLNPGVVALQAEVSPDNINDLLAAHGFAGEVDLFSLDIDSYDYWVFEALAVASPRLLVLEYNAAFGPDRALTIPRAQSLAGAPKAYRGASLAALEKLARRKGYRLVACENAGVNAFFLRNDVAPEVPGLTPAVAFRPALDRRDVTEVVRADAPPAAADPQFPLIEV